MDNIFTLNNFKDELKCKGYKNDIVNSLREMFQFLLPKNIVAAVTRREKHCKSANNKEKITCCTTERVKISRLVGGPKDSYVDFLVKTGSIESATTFLTV